MTKNRLQALRAQGLTFQAIADRFGCSRQAVQQKLIYTPTFGKRGAKRKSDAARPCPRCGHTIPAGRITTGQRRQCYPCTRVSGRS